MAFSLSQLKGDIIERFCGIRGGKEKKKIIVAEKK